MKYCSVNLRIPSDYPEFGSQSCLCHSATLKTGLGGTSIKNNMGKTHKPIVGQNKCHQEKSQNRKNGHKHYIDRQSLHIVFLIHWPVMTTSKCYFSIYFDNKHTQSIVIEAAYFNISLSTTLTGILIIFIHETMPLPLILELFLI